MWHTSAYSASVTNGLTDTALNALNDNVFRIGAANGFVMQGDVAPLFALVAPVNGTAARLKSPKFSPFGPIEIIPLQAAARTGDGTLIAVWPFRPPRFRAQEEVTAAVDTGGAAPGQETLVVSWGMSIDPIPAGEELTLKLTSTTAATANAWSQLTLVQATTIPQGMYAIVGSEHISANAIAHRFTFWNQYPRPGFPSTTSRSNRQWPGIRDYRMGLAGTFQNVTLPNLEVLCSAADASHTLFWRAIKIG